MKYYVGLDVSMKETLILQKVGVESGAISHWLVEELRRLEIPAVCIDARKMAAILSIRINKTDKNDAKGIADAMRSGLYREVISKSQRAIEIGTLVGSRRLLVEQKVRLTNAIRGHLKTYGIRLGTSGDASFGKKVREVLSKGYEIAGKGIDGLLNSFEKIHEEIRVLIKEIENLAIADQQVQRFMTIPGIGIITAMTYQIEIDDLNRFRNSRAVGAYLGMTPKQYSSGETKKQGKISKCGSSEMRRLLNEAAIVMLTRSKRWSKLKAWGLKLQRKHGFKKACMGVGRKLAVIMHRMWLDKTDFIYEERKEERIVDTFGLARAT